MDKSTPFTHPPDDYKPSQCGKCNFKDAEIDRLTAENERLQACFNQRNEAFIKSCALRRDIEDENERLNERIEIRGDTINKLSADNERLRATIDRVHELIVAGRYQAAEVECEAIQHKDPDDKESK